MASLLPRSARDVTETRARLGRQYLAMNPNDYRRHIATSTPFPERV
jgi:hypothetical protein